MFRIKLLKKLLAPSNGTCRFGIKSIRTFFVEKPNAFMQTVWLYAMVIPLPVLIFF